MRGSAGGPRSSVDARPREPGAARGSGGGRAALDSARAAYFELLRQLQNAVRAVILTATVGSSSVRCSDGLCVQLLRLVRSCLLAGRRRLTRADPELSDLLFLLIVPEFSAAFECDLEFVAYLLNTHGTAAFVQELFKDTARTAHFYLEFAIMRDEELFLAFVSSLLALQEVTFQPGSRSLANRCVSASLKELRLSPVLWGHGRGAHPAAHSLPDRHPQASNPDSTEPQSDFASLADAADEADPFLAFIGARQPAAQSAASGEWKVSNSAACAVEEDCALDGSGEAALTPAAVDDSLLQGPQGACAEELATLSPAVKGPQAAGSPAAGQHAAGEDEPAEGMPTVVGGEAILSCPTILLECSAEPLGAARTATPERSPRASEPGNGDSASAQQVREAPGHEPAEVCSRRAADFAGPVGDAFGLEESTTGQSTPELVLSLRDLAITFARPRPARPRRPARPPPRLTCAGLQHSAGPLPGAGPTPSGCSSGPRTGTALAPGGRPGDRCGPDSEADEADDAVASLEGLWESSRKDGAQRLLSSGAGSDSKAQGAAAYQRSSDESYYGSPPSSTAVTPRGSSSLRASVDGGLLGYEDDAFSDSGSSEFSSIQSVSGASVLGSQGDRGSRLDVPSMPSAFGVHLEWRLRLPPRPPLPQRGACPACRARLQASLMSQPRYCHYLGSYFCGGCHRGELRVIPARVVERWDFGPRKVCHEAAKYLDMQNDQPLIPITEIRRTKLTTQAALTEVHGLRQKLSRIREIAADSDCDFIKVLLDMLLKQLPSHMMQGHDLYTLEDLIQLENKGKYCDFFQKLKDLVKKAAEHIIECPTCKVDAQTCLLCLSARPVYAFQVDECITCRRCKVLYHAVCFRRAGMECPQCMQLRAHERKPSLSDVRAR